jgi:hypothetical protein
VPLGSVQNPQIMRSAPPAEARCTAEGPQATAETRPPGCAASRHPGSPGSPDSRSPRSPPQSRRPVPRLPPARRSRHGPPAALDPVPRPAAARLPLPRTIPPIGCARAESAGRIPDSDSRFRSGQAPGPASRSASRPAPRLQGTRPGPGDRAQERPARWRASSGVRMSGVQGPPNA